MDRRGAKTKLAPVARPRGSHPAIISIVKSRADRSEANTLLSSRLVRTDRTHRGAHQGDLHVRRVNGPFDVHADDAVTTGVPGVAQHTRRGVRKGRRVGARGADDLALTPVPVAVGNRMQRYAR